jgi:hypothetical protein
MHLRPMKSSSALHTVSKRVSPSSPCDPNHGALTRQGYRESRHNSLSLGLPGPYCVSPPLGALDRFAPIAVPECVTEISVANMSNAARRFAAEILQPTQPRQVHLTAIRHMAYS